MVTNSSTELTAVYLRQYQSHTKTRPDGSKLIRLEGQLYDLFQGRGWDMVSRFRVIRVRESGKRSLIQISGVPLSTELRNTIMGELFPSGV